MFIGTPCIYLHRKGMLIISKLSLSKIYSYNYTMVIFAAIMYKIYIIFLISILTRQVLGKKQCCHTNSSFRYGMQQERLLYYLVIDQMFRYCVISLIWSSSLSLFFFTWVTTLAQVSGIARGIVENRYLGKNRFLKKKKFDLKKLFLLSNVTPGYPRLASYS